MLYVGYPIRYETALRLFKLDDSTHWKDVLSIIAKTGLDLHPIDKGLNILGMTVKQVEYSAATYCSADDCVVAVLQAKKTVTELVQKAELDISELEIGFMEEESFVANNPQPYVMSF